MGEGVKGFCFALWMFFSGTLKSRLGLLCNQLEVSFCWFYVAAASWIMEKTW